MVESNRFANALAGFGAGLQGRGPEFMAQQQELQRQQALGDLFNNSSGPLDPGMSAPGQPNQPQDIGALLQRAAQIEPQYLGAYATYAAKQAEAMRPKYKTQEAGGKIIRWDENNPNTAPEVVYGGSLTDTKGEVTLRKEFEGLQPVKDYRTIDGAFKKLEAVANAEPSPTNDMALVFSLMKIYDPNSVVRETEYATAENARGVPESIAAQWNKVKDGERLSPQQRENFVQTAADLHGAQTEGYNQLADRYQGLAKDYGYEPKRIADVAAVKPRIPAELRAPEKSEQQPVQATTGLTRDEWLKRRPK